MTVNALVLERIEHYMYVEDLEWLVYLLMVVTVVILIYGLYRFYKKWTYGGSKLTIDNIPSRVKNAIIYGILQRKVLMKGFEGTMHLLIFIGIIILFIATILRAIEYDIAVKIFNTQFITGVYYLVYKLIINIAGLIVIVGVIVAIVRRALKLTRDLPTTIIDYIVLLDLLVIVVTGFILDSILTYTYRLEWINSWDFMGYALSGLWFGLSKETITLTYRVTWLIHMIIALASIALIPYSKFSHIIIGGLINTFFSRLEHPSSYKPIPNIEKIVEEGGVLGVQKLIDTSWKERMDYDSCIKCARCHNVCPANLTDKPLSPMNFILKMRELIDKRLWEEVVAPNHVEPNVIWSCVTCGACVYECPMLIHHVESILDIRRSLFATGENVPDELLQVSYNIMRTGNPLGFNPADRESWVKELASEIGVEIAEEGKEYDYIYWMGCHISYDPNARGSGIALLKILKMLGYKVAILPEEHCCGEPARRIGDELMFYETVKNVGELLSKYKFKKLIVSCPHGYNVFKHEYPQYGYKFEVEHYTQLLSKAIREGKLNIKGELNIKLTYHDPCYLGRWNGIFEEPREIIRSIKGVEFIEMPRNRGRSFCCGGGGGHCFYDIKIGERIGKVRVEESHKTGAKVIAVACPYCNIMLKSEALNYDMEVYDIAELVIKAIEGK